MAELIQKSKVPVMKVGKHTAADGKPVTFTEADLDGMIRNFSGDISKGYRPPVVLGHPKMDEPRYGDCLALERKDGVLFADFGVIPELDAQLKKGQYPERSLRLAKSMTDGTYHIRHLGLLGVVPPAVEGLPAYQFSAEQDGDAPMTIDFSGSEAWTINTIGNVFQRLRDFLIEKYDQATADRIVDSYDIDQMKNCTAEDTTDNATAEAMPMNFNQSQKEEEMGEQEELKTKLTEAEGKIADFAKTDQEQKARIRVLLAEGRQKDFSAFCDGLQKEGKLSPGMVPYVMDFMEILSGVETFDFAEGDGKKAAPPVEKFKTLLSTYPKIIEFSAVAEKDKARAGGDATEQREQLVSDFMKSNEGTTYKDAVIAVSKDHPEMFEER